MSDATGIEWTDATAMVDRGGRRTRFYCRAEPSRPGQQERRRKAAEGLKWCRGCREWLVADSVRQGACRDCLAAEERARYAADEGFREYRKNQRDFRRRAVDRIAPSSAEMLLEMFDGECAYCPAPATTWDHAIAVTHGGSSRAGNMVPACSSCNSRKRNRDLDDWIDNHAPEPKVLMIEYLAAMGTL
jgi:5-methylcytosine-specific restriction endonuclease McrA